MVSGSSSEWPPPGWIEQVKVKNGRRIKIYSNVETGQKFYSKKDVFRYLKREDVTPSVSQPTKNDEKQLESSATPLEVIKNDSPEWLPPGWSMELKTRMSGLHAGTTYKCYVESSSGRRFYSKSAATKYLQAANDNMDTTERNGEETGLFMNHHVGGTSTDKLNSPQSSKSVKRKYISETSAAADEDHSLKKDSSDLVGSNGLDGLPPGWIKEIRTKKNASGIRKDPYYIDPVSGYIFRSKKDALRYLETGDIRSCAIRPKKREINDFDLNKVDNNHNDREELSSHQGLCQSSESIKRRQTRKIEKTGAGNNSMNISSDVVKCNQSGGLPPRRAKEVKIRSNASETEKDPISARTGPSIEWLPPGWSMELKARKSGSTYKCYIDPSTGLKFYSKSAVTRYLEAVNDSKRTGIQNEEGTRSGSNLNVREESLLKQDLPQGDKSVKDRNISGKKEDVTRKGTSKGVVEINPLDGLPPGWIKEIRTRKYAQGIKKDPYYIDPVSGYMFRSKRDALRYIKTGDIRSCAVRPKKKDADDMELKDAEHQDIGEISSYAATPDKRVANRIEPVRDVNGVVVKSTDSPGWLPHEWSTELKTGKTGRTYKCYTDPTTGRKFYSKPEVIQYLDGIDNRESTSKQKKEGTTNHSASGKPSLRVDMARNSKSVKGVSRGKVLSKKKKTGNRKKSTKTTSSGMVKSNPVDGLPPGWILEFKPRKQANKTKKDPFYIDPVSGYMFRSKKDALRYLETGDIGSCVCRPKKRDTDNLESPVPLDEKKPKDTATRALVTGAQSTDGTGKEITEALTSAEAEAEAEAENSKNKRRRAAPKSGSSKKRQHNEIAGDISTTSPAEVLEGSVVGISMEAGQPPNSSGGARLANSSNKKLQTGSRKPKNQQTLVTPSRVSKRLAGNKQDLAGGPSNKQDMASGGPSEGALPVAGGKFDNHKEITPSSSTLNPTTHEEPHDFDLEKMPRTPVHLSPDRYSVSATQEASNNEAPQAEDGQAPEEPRGKLINEKQGDGNPRSQDVQVNYSVGECWSDPSLEFAFKTLTGSLSVENTLPLQENSQKQPHSSAYAQTSESLEVPGFDIPGFCSKVIPPHFDPFQKPAPKEQLPFDPSIPPGFGTEVGSSQQHSVEPNAKNN